MNSVSSTIKAGKPGVQNSWLFCLILIVLFLTPYSVISHLPLQRNTLPFIWGEQYIPFLPWTFIVYFSAFVQFAIVVRYMPKPLLRKTISVLSLSVLAGLAVFLFYPVQFPRELFLTNNAFVNRFQQVDSAGNCFPSLHVLITVAFGFCYTLIQPSKTKQAFMWLWTILIIISVLTTKQHYVLDIFGGIAFAIVPIIVLKRYARQNGYNQ